MEKFKVLIIDDDHDMRMALNARLRGQGYAEGTGQRALAAGAVAYFQKPIDNEGLLLEIAERAAERRAG